MIVNKVVMKNLLLAYMKLYQKVFARISNRLWLFSDYDFKKDYNKMDPDKTFFNIKAYDYEKDGWRLEGITVNGVQCRIRPVNIKAGVVGRGLGIWIDPKNLVIEEIDHNSLFVSQHGNTTVRKYVVKITTVDASFSPKIVGSPWDNKIPLLKIEDGVAFSYMHSKKLSDDFIEMGLAEESVSERGLRLEDRLFERRLEYIDSKFIIDVDPKKMGNIESNMG